MHLSFRNKASTRLFLFFDRLGIHVLPKHFYTPVADYHWLRHNRDLWESAWDMSGVHWDLDEQMTWLEEVCSTYRGEVAGLTLYHEMHAAGLGYGYGPIESQVLHCFVRKVAPRRILEIGSGLSTACIVEAVKRNGVEGRPATDIACVEPFPRKQFANLTGVRHIESPVQTVDRAIFDTLNAGDLLFIDSSHAVKTGSDVSVLLLYVLPKLRSGVHIHIHDVNLPYLYARELLHTIFGWQETVLLAALLSGNSRFRVNASLSGLHYGRQSALKKLLPDYRPQSSQSGLRPPDENPHLHFPSSIYLQVR